MLRPMSDHDEAFFAAPSIEGAKLALPLLVDGDPDLQVFKLCAVAIDVFDAEGTLIQRALAHAEVGTEVREGFRELVDRSVTRFADAQDLDVAREASGGPYRG